ncbi:ureidoglycolate hydrolase [Astrocystis sublimbata]|nr:ureidoglycolate hydrolase [Astrocystis sublimbata]
MLVRSTSITEALTITAAPLSRDAFAPFGEVIANPAPESRPSNTSPAAIARGALPCGAISANQGTAIQYKALASLRDLYGSAPSGKAGTPRMTMFVCGARTLVSREGGEGEGGSESRNARENTSDGGVQIRVLERHPFTSQTFIPLTADRTKRYLVVVAPTLDATGQDEDEDLPAPARDAGLPGRGLPDPTRLAAFVATGEQAVTYGPGTWHAPMIALGPPESTIDFVVVQFANDVPVEDCQEVALEDGGDGDGDGAIASGIWVGIPQKNVLTKL